MQPADGVTRDAVDTRSHWRGALIGVGVAVAAGLLTVLAPQPAHADDDTSGLLGTLVGDVTAAATEVVEPVVAPLPDVRELPVVGGLVGEIADSAPVAAVTEPVARLVDTALGDTVASVPLVGGLLGGEPVGSIIDPVSGVVDGTLSELVGTPPVAAPNVTAPDATAAAQPPASAELWLGSAAAGFAADILMNSRAADALVAIAVGVEGPFHGPVSAPGDIAPTSAVTASGTPIGLAVAVLGAGLLFFLARGHVRPAGVRAPPSPVYGTDTSPD